MNAALDLAAIGTGFVQPALHSQRVFRTALRVLSRPGEVGEIDVPLDVPNGLHGAAGAVLLALLDQDTRLWLSPTFSPDVFRYVSFHTGCAHVTDTADADFALVEYGSALPPLNAFAQGDADFPDRSTTILQQVASLSGGTRWSLAGPGIDGTATMSVDGMPDSFVGTWMAQHRVFPCGVDFFLAADRHLAGLPRTTRIGT